MPTPAIPAPPDTTSSTAGRSASAARTAIFDFDGVIVRGDTFARFIRRRYARQWWRVVVVLPLVPIVIVLAPFRRWRGRFLHAAIRWALLGVGEARYRRLASAFAIGLAHDARNLIRDGCTALNTHRHAGDRVVVATGCETTLARTVLDELGFADVELVASQLTPARFGLRLSMRNVGVEKAHQLARLGIRPPWDICYSDSALDLPILAAARAAVLVNPDRVALARVSARLRRRLAIREWR